MGIQQNQSILRLVLIPHKFHVYLHIIKNLTDDKNRITV